MKVPESERDEDSSEDDATLEVTGGFDARDAPSALDFGSLSREDLSEEHSLRNCEWTEYSGYRCPSLGGYPLLRRIGHGGMGTVFAGVHPRLDNEVAVKLLHRDLDRRDPTLAKRFLREAKLAANLSARSPHLVRVHDVNRDEATGAFFLVMEYVQGISAQQWIDTNDEERLPESAALELMSAAAAGLVIAHRHGVVHRDIKPDNILIPMGSRGPRLSAAKVTDLGLARADHQKLGLTSSNQIMLGTPGYAAPEQLEDASGARKPADVFAMGAMLYALLTGGPPFEGNTPMGRVISTLELRMLPLGEVRDDLSDATLSLVETCLAREPTERFADASALQQAIDVCRASLRQGGSEPTEALERVEELSHRSESGHKAVSTMMSAALNRRSRVFLEGGPAGATIEFVSAAEDGATVTAELDDEGRFRAHDIEPGEYTLVAKHDDHEEFRVRIEVRAGGDTNCLISMRERAAFLSVESDPRGARVTVDGRRVGVTPVRKLSVRAGAHEVRLTHPGHASVVQTVRVRGGRSADLGKLTLEPSSRVDLSDFPPEFTFTLDGDDVADGQEIDPGLHRLEVRRPGYDTQHRTVKAVSGEALRPQLGRWRLNAAALLNDAQLWSAASSDDRRRASEVLGAALDDFDFVKIERIHDDALDTAVFRHVVTELEFVLVPGATFRMGSPPDEPHRRSDERCHPVSLSPYLIARTPVTGSAWKAAKAGAVPGDVSPNAPVVALGWQKAQSFCESVRLQLPTEAQWEYACRSGAEGAFHFGDDVTAIDGFAWHGGDGRRTPPPVAAKRPNAFGLYDMHGGVWEWCADGYGEYPFDAATDPVGAHAGAYRVLRGGSWRDTPWSARSAMRAAFLPDRAAPDIGLRPAFAVNGIELSEAAVTAEIRPATTAINEEETRG